MTIASKSGGLILKSGSLATNCGCCGCVLPALPDAVEIDISRGNSQYAGLVIGKSPAGGPEEKKFATGIAWTFPDGTFTLTPTVQTNALTLYEYTNVIKGASLQVGMQRAANGNTSIAATILLYPCRQKTLIDSESPPTLDDLLNDEWTDPASLVEFHPAYTLGNATYQFRRSSLGSGSSINNTNEVTLQDNCAASTGNTTRIASASAFVVQQSIKACFAEGCIFPANVTIAAQLWVPHTSGLLPFITSDLSAHRSSPGLFYAFSTQGIMPTLSGTPAVTGECTGTIASVMLLYGGSERALFQPRGANACSAQQYGITNLGSC